MFKAITLLLILIFSLSINIFSQESIAFSHLTVDNGLSQSAVTCIFQDQRGFMWFGTQDGLNRYDGYRFKVFKNIPSDTTSLTDNFIFSIYEDKAGVLYIETQSGTLHRYNAVTESFSVLSNDALDLTKAKSSTVGAVLYESSGIKWVGGASRGTGLEKTNLKTGEVIHYKNNPSDPTSLINDKVYSIFRDSKGNLWVGTFNGLDKLDEKTGKFTHYKKDPNNSNSLPDNWIWPIFEDSRGNLWFGTVRGGLSRFDPKTKIFTNFKNNPDDPRSLNDDFIFSIFEDRSGIIWIGTNSGGVNFFHPASQIFERVFKVPNEKNSLSENSILSIQPDKEGNYWLGTGGGGLNKYNYNLKTFKNYLHNPANPNSLIDNTITVIEEDNSGLLWLGTFSSGMNSFDPKTEIFKKYINDPSNANTISDNRVYEIFEDSEGIIWIGTYGGGLNRFDKKTGKFKVFKKNDNNTNSISSNSVWSIVEDNNGVLWIGTFGGGVNTFDRKLEKFNNYKNDPDNPSSLPDDNIIRVFKDSKNNMWFATTKGFSRFDRDTKKFKTYREINGLANDMVFGIIEDDKGFLWLSTNDGISKFSPKDESFKNYYYQDGLQSNEFNQNAYAKDQASGRLLFGGPKGLTIFNPNNIKTNTYVPSVVFTNYLRYNSDDEEGKPIVEKGISERDSILLTYKDNIVSLDFAALSFLNNFENEYKYLLEGFNENWIQLGNNHTITFTNLSPGEYKLRVIGSNNDGLWNEKGATLFIEVLPPWWRTNLAYGIYFIAFFALLFGIRRVEINRREQKAQIRESALRIKATEAEKRALQIENDRKTKELEEARQLQLSMLPKQLPILSNLEIAAFMRTATEVGGDYYDFRVHPNGELYVAFGDATGHGLQAGTMVTLMKGFFTSDSSKLGMQEFMDHCSRMIKEIELGRILMSFSYMKIENSKMVLSSAGMPPIFYYNSKESLVEEIIIQGMPLGAMKSFPYKVIEKEINTGDSILLLSDGLPEQMNPNEEMFDYYRVKENFLSYANDQPNDIIKKLIKDGDEWMNGRMQDDDITMVVIKVK